MAIKIDGLDEVIEKLNNLKDIEEKLAPTIKKTTLKVEARAKKETPVDTGSLRGSIETKFTAGKNLLRARIKPSTDYAKYVHEGTGIFRGGGDSPSTGRIRAGTTNPGAGGIRPNRFMRRAERWAKATKLFTKTLKKEINNLIK